MARDASASKLSDGSASISSATVSGSVGASSAAANGSVAISAATKGSAGGACTGGGVSATADGSGGTLTRWLVSCAGSVTAPGASRIGTPESRAVASACSNEARSREISSSAGLSGISDGETTSTQYPRRCKASRTSAASSGWCVMILASAMAQFLNQEFRRWDALSAIS